MSCQIVDALELQLMCSGSMASGISEHLDDQSDATSDSFSLRLTPSPIDDESEFNNYGTSVSDNDDDSVACHLCHADGLIRKHIRVHLEVKHCVSKESNIQKLYYRRLKSTCVTEQVDAELSVPTEPKRARSQSPLTNGVNGTSPCLRSHAPSDISSVSSSCNSSSKGHITDIRFSCERFKCHVCATVVHTKSAMMGHFFVFHPTMSLDTSLKRQKMGVLLTKLTEDEIMREMLPDPLDTSVDGDIHLTSGFIIEHVPEIKVAGELVWAKLTGFPWWPGVILDDPRTKCHFRTARPHSCASAETEYNVLFFDKQSMQRAWIAESNLETYQTDHQKHLTKPQSNKFKVRFSEANAWAAEVYDWSTSERRKFFASSFEGKT